MKNFNYNRCLQVIKWNIIANKKQLINRIAVSAIVTVIVHCLNTGLLWSDDINTVRIASTSNALMSFGAIYMLVFATRFNFNMKKKGDIINYTMLPATKMEKFCANWFLQVPLVFVILIAGLLMGDMVQMIISILIHNDCYSIVVDMINTSLPTFMFLHSSFLENAIWLLAVCIFHATFIYGGVFFRRHPESLTLVCWIIFPMILGAIGCGVFAAVVYLFENTNYEIAIEWLVSPETISVISKLFCLCAEMFILALVYWLAYHRFCRTQVINNRFYNK